jgi:hypothetical protein
MVQHLLLKWTACVCAILEDGFVIILMPHVVVCVHFLISSYSPTHLKATCSYNILPFPACLDPRLPAACRLILDILYKVLPILLETCTFFRFLRTRVLVLYKITIIKMSLRYSKVILQISLGSSSRSKIRKINSFNKFRRLYAKYR